MALALEQARKSRAEGGVPIGAILAKDREVLAAGRNRRVQNGDPTAHGELDCIRRAGRRKSYRDLTLYTTLSPCMMCTGTILQFKIRVVVIGENFNFAGNIPLLKKEGVETILLNDPKCIEMMSEFIRERSDLWSEDISE